MNWAAIDADPRFQALHRKKTTFLWGLMIFSTIYYFLLRSRPPIFQELFKIKVWGVVNVGNSVRVVRVRRGLDIAFVLFEKANAEFDAMAQVI